MASYAYDIKINHVSILYSRISAYQVGMSRMLLYLPDKNTNIKLGKNKYRHKLR
jgi:hypothetical protein